jgi:hypothetical protein
MAHNDEAGGSDDDVLRSLQLSLDEPDVLYWQRIPMPVQFKLPHGWHISNAGFAVPPSPPAGPHVQALARERRNQMMPAKRKLPANTLGSPNWPQRFEDERVVKVARAAGRSRGRFNTVGRRAWWDGREVNATLRQYDFLQIVRGDPPHVPLYFPQPKCMAPVTLTLQRAPPERTVASGSSRTGSSAAGDRTRSAAPRRRHPRWGEARVLCSDPSDDGVRPLSPPQAGGRRDLATTSTGEEAMVGEGGRGGPPWRRR